MRERRELCHENMPMNGQVLRFEGGVGKGEGCGVRREQLSTKNMPYGRIFHVWLQVEAGQHENVSVWTCFRVSV